MIIKLTTHEGRDLFVNIDHIVTFNNAPKNALGDRNLVLLYLAFGPNVTGYHVQGTAEDLMQQVNEEELRGIETGDTNEYGVSPSYEAARADIGSRDIPSWSFPVKSPSQRMQEIWTNPNPPKEEELDNEVVWDFTIWPHTGSICQGIVSAVDEDEATDKAETQFLSKYPKGDAPHIEEISIELHDFGRDADDENDRKKEPQGDEQIPGQTSLEEFIDPPDAPKDPEDAPF